MTAFATFPTGSRVYTRRMKEGTVVSCDDAAFTVDVRFGSKVFTMSQGSVVSAELTDKASRRNYATNRAQS